MYFPPYSLDWAHIKSNARLPRVYSRGLCEIFQFGRAFSPFRQDRPTFSRCTLNKQGATHAKS